MRGIAAFAVAEVGQPAPGEDALDADDEVVAEGSDGGEERFRCGREVPVEHRLSGLVEDADVQRAGVEIDSAVLSVLRGVESHRGLLLSRTGGQDRHVIAAMPRRGPQ